MYFPYLRGRQNELICIRELLELDKLGKRIIPVIEPVRFNSTFFSALVQFIEKERKVILIRNPKVGSFEKEYCEMKKKYTFIPNDIDFQDEVVGNTVVLEDGYVKEKRNVDYIENPDAFFSRNHIVYKKRGYAGFADYSIVGEMYEESGFAPLAIAIHMMYYGNKQELRVHHFVSDSNENSSDPARKFEEAMKNMLSWELFDQIPKTEGLNRLLDCYNNGKFPGLGVIKRYSLMHHMQMISELLGDE